MQPVSDYEVNGRRHNAYLRVVSNLAGDLETAMERMVGAAARARQSRSDDDLDRAAATCENVTRLAQAFLQSLSSAEPPVYLQGADAELTDGLKAVSDCGLRGHEAALARHGEGLSDAAASLHSGSRDIESAAQRLAGWRSGAARL